MVTSVIDEVTALNSVLLEQFWGRDTSPPVEQHIRERNGENGSNGMKFRVRLMQTMLTPTKSAAEMRTGARRVSRAIEMKNPAIDAGMARTTSPAARAGWALAHLARSATISLFMLKAVAQIA